MYMKTTIVNSLFKLVDLNRGHTDLAALEQTWGMDRIDIPRAPGLGLVLEEVHYDR